MLNDMCSLSGSDISWTASQSEYESEIQDGGTTEEEQNWASNIIAIEW